MKTAVVDLLQYNALAPMKWRFHVKANMLECPYRRLTYRPLNTAARFSLNASTPSR